MSVADLPPSSAALHNGDSGTKEAGNSEFSKETTGPMIQWKFGETLRSRSDVAMTNEALCQGLP